MEYLGIILSGTSGSGKTTISRYLQEKYKIFKQVPAVTTRLKRESDKDDYIYVTMEEFLELKERNELFIEAEYRGNYYGITYESIEKVNRTKKVPILVITPESVKKLNNNSSSSYLSFFIDEEDNELNKRLLIEKKDEKTFIQRSTDRQFINCCIYYLLNHSLEDSCSCIFELWNYRNTSGVLSKRIIESMINCGLLLKNGNKENVKGASYDLSLGDEYYYKGKIDNMNNFKPFVKIEPYDYIIATSKELINFSRDVTGRFDLSVSLFCQGVILSNGPCIDPGFRGRLFCLLFNTSNQTIHLKRGQHYATLEMSKLIEHTEGYTGKYQDKDKISDYLPSNSLQGGINELKKEVEELKKESKALQTALLGFISLMVAVISLLLIR